jgi:hypothetical protein
MVRPAASILVPAEWNRDEAEDKEQAAASLPSLAERVERALRATGYAPLRAVDVSVSGQLVTLRGRVPSYYMKQIAQSVAVDVAAGQWLRNDLEVVRPH